MDAIAADLRELLPRRPAKPRTTGLTAVIDFGPGAMGWTGSSGLADLLEAAGDFIDMAKIYALNSLLLPSSYLRSAVERYHAAGVDVYAGGILFEFALQNGAVERLPGLLHDLGIRSAEVSENYIVLSDDERRRHIEALGRAGLGVVYEFGRKKPDEPFSPEHLERMTKEMRGLGVDHVIVEQSEIDILEAHDPKALADIAAAPWFSHLLIECDPTRFPGQHADLVGRLGPEVNLANVGAGQVLGLECTRRGIGRPVDYALIREARNVRGH